MCGAAGMSKLTSEASSIRCVVVKLVLQNGSLLEEAFIGAGGLHDGIVKNRALWTKRKVMMHRRRRGL
jgi:hypothetical protein